MSTWVATLTALLLSVIAVALLTSRPTFPRAEWAPPTPSDGAPALGTDAIDAKGLRSTLADMGRSSISWNVSYMSDDERVDTDLLDESAALGVVHHVITIEFWSLADEHGVLRSIADGAVDQHLTRIAGQLEAWHRRHPRAELIVRPLHEANLPTYPWGFAAGNGHGNSEEDFAPAWDHVWHVMHDVSPGLRFFLCPNGGDRSSYDWGVLQSEVDYVGHDLYNRSQEFGGWSPPGPLHDATVRAVQAAYPGKPYVIGETGTSEPGPGVTGHSKAEWFRELAEWMAGPARTFGIVAVCYFDHDSRDEGNDWRIHPTGKPDAEASRRTFQIAFAGFG